MIALCICAAGLSANSVFDRGLRRAFWTQGRRISMRHEILAVARSVSVVDVCALAAALDDGRARPRVRAQCEAACDDRVNCSPHVFLYDGADLATPGVQARWVNGNFGVDFGDRLGRPHGVRDAPEARRRTGGGTDARMTIFWPRLFGSGDGRTVFVIIDGLGGAISRVTSADTAFPHRNASMPNWAQAYYGDNLTRLRQVAQRYDPERLFTFPQTITTA